MVDPAEVKEFELSEEMYKQILRLSGSYKKEAEKCAKAKAYFAGCVLIGAAMEAVLISTTHCFPEMAMEAKGAPKIKGKIKPLINWRFEELLRVAQELNWLPSGLSPGEGWDEDRAQIGDCIAVVKQVRNLIHPTRYANDFSGKRVTKVHYELCYRYVNEAVTCQQLLLKTWIRQIRKDKIRREKGRPQQELGNSVGISDV